jgi:hypothetical protein
MRIKSDFKDYYDYIPHQYGGGDPKIIYPRAHRISEDRRSQEGCIRGFPSLGERNWMTRQYKWETLGFPAEPPFKWAVVCGKYYPIMGLLELWIPEGNQSGLIFNNQTGKCFKVACWELVQEDSVLYKALFPANPWSGVPPVFGHFSEDLVKLSKRVGQPVFSIESYRYPKPGGVVQDITIDAEVPNLGALGFPKIISAEKMYQDLAYFVGNLIHDTPDLQPPKTLTNDENIIRHGFDLKKSFRK